MYRIISQVGTLYGVLDTSDMSVEYLDVDTLKSYAGMVAIEGYSSDGKIFVDNDFYVPFNSLGSLVAPFYGDVVGSRGFTKIDKCKYVYTLGKKQIKFRLVAFCASSKQEFGYDVWFSNGIKTFMPMEIAYKCGFQPEVLVPSSVTDGFLGVIRYSSGVKSAVNTALTMLSHDCTVQLDMLRGVESDVMKGLGFTSGNLASVNVLLNGVHYVTMMARGVVHLYALSLATGKVTKRAFSCKKIAAKGLSPVCACFSGTQLKVIAHGASSDNRGYVAVTLLDVMK